MTDITENKQPHLLIAEDNSANLEVATAFLAAAGYRITAAQDGATAVAKAAELQPDAILMDIQMPGMNGLEATRKIKDQPATSHIPIIAVTALAMSGDEERCLEAGADEYVTKPVHYRSLLDLLQKTLRRSD